MSVEKKENYDWITPEIMQEGLERVVAERETIETLLAHGEINQFLLEFYNNEVLEYLGENREKFDPNYEEPDDEELDDEEDEE